MRKLFLLLIISFTACSEKDQIQDTCKLDGVDGQVCIEIYEPVCGCNNKTYSNSCYAQIDGVTSWTNGVCKN